MKRLVVCALLFGCAGDDSGGGGGGSPIAIEDFGMRLGEVSCQKVFECCTDPEIMKQFMGITYMNMPITTQDQCVGFTAGFLNGLALPQWQASIAAGRMGYDPNAAGCVAAVAASLSCAEYASAQSGGPIPASASSCGPFLIPMVANDGACMHDNECISDNCVGETSSADGACKPMPGVGEPCDSNCANGNYCGYASGSTMRTCQALKANGMQCMSSDECTSDNCDSSVTPKVCAAKNTCDGR